MFDLEQSIAEWRRQMSAAGIKSPVPLDELESHLREDIERQMREGQSASMAFETAAARIGDAALIKKEFGKIQTPQIMIRTIAIILALFAMVFGLAMVLPQLGQWSRTGILQSPPALVTGAALAMAGGIAAFFGIRSHREARGRKLIALAVIGAGVFYALPLVIAFFQTRKTDLAGWLFCAGLASASVVFFGSCFYINKRVHV